MAPSSETPSTSLTFFSLNDTQPTTIVLLHGASSCHLEFAHVIPLLPAYHLLIPDLPGHSGSRSIKPATADNAAMHVERLIRDHAHGGRAHVVGMSMGGQIAQRVATAAPSLVRSLFVSGASPFAGWARWFAVRPALVYGLFGLQVHWSADALYWWLSETYGVKRHEELRVEMRANTTRELIRDVFTSMLAWGQEDVGGMRVRALAVAGGKGDNVPEVAEMGRRLRERRGPDGEEAWPQDGSGAVVVRNAIHAWDLQLPELFAKGIVAWVEGEDLPAEYERL